MNIVIHLLILFTCLIAKTEYSECVNERCEKVHKH